tara:strand:+ start:64 stop:327 length:264 start_codon:yes stop_codon:yes gene_type:complete
MNQERNNFDTAVGAKIRSRRLALNLTQTKLANKVGVTFQQIQKYEKGTNGTSSYRLKTIAECLKVPVLWFYEYPIIKKEVEDDKSQS